MPAHSHASIKTVNELVFQYALVLAWIDVAL